MKLYDNKSKKIKIILRATYIIKNFEKNLIKVVNHLKIKAKCKNNNKNRIYFNKITKEKKELRLSKGKSPKYIRIIK